MKPIRLLIPLSVLLLFTSTNVSGGDENDALSPEKAQLIYKAFIPAEKPPAKEKPAASALAAEKTDQQVQRIAKIMHKRHIKLLGQPGLWEFEYQGRQIFLLIDESAGMACLITPVAALDKLRAKPDFDEPQLFEKLLKANYMLTQEVRFALNRKIIWVTYVHPVDSLVERDIARALDRLVETAARTFEGT